MAKKLKQNLGNHGTNNKCQITAMDLVNKVTGDDHVLNERSRTTEDEIKGNTLIYMNKTQPEYYEYFQGEHGTKEYELGYDILKYDYELPF